MLDWIRAYKKTLMYGGLVLLAMVFLTVSLAVFFNPGIQDPTGEVKKEGQETTEEVGDQEMTLAGPSWAVEQVSLHVGANERLNISVKLWADWKKAQVKAPEIVVAPVDDEEDPENDKKQEEADKGTSEEVQIGDIIQNGGNAGSNTGSDTGESESSGGSTGESAGSGAGESQGVTYGIDVSKWQGDVNWKQVAASGVEFAIVRCGYRGNATGKIAMDPYYRQNMSGALSNGIPVGVYFYSQAIDEAEAREEALWVLEVVKDYDITYPIVFDYEGIGENRIKDVTKTQRTNNALAFMEVIQEAGYTPMMYASKNGYNNNWETSRFTDCKIWLAHYTSGGKPSDYKGRYDMWQYTSKGVVPGISGYTDMNIAYFKYSNGNATGKVGEVTCQVVDPAGAPVAGVTVTLSGTLNYSAVTGADGSVKFTDVRLDTYTAEVTKAPDGYIIESADQKTVTIGKAQASFQVGTLTATVAEKPPLAADETEVSGVIVKDAVGRVQVNTGKLNVRSLPVSDGSTVYGQVVSGDILRFTGTCSNGWYRIEFQGKTAYISGAYVKLLEDSEESSEASTESAAEESSPEGASAESSSETASSAAE